MLLSFRVPQGAGAGSIHTDSTRGCNEDGVALGEPHYEGDKLGQGLFT